MAGQAERIQELEGQVADLQARLAQLDSSVSARIGQLEPTPGLSGSKDPWTVQVGGQSVELKALTDEQWVRALGELPAFLLAYIGGKQGGKANDPEILKRAKTTAQSWILSCALRPQEVRLERLTVPEALEAVKVIAGLNGVDAALGQFFRERLLGPAAGSGGAALRGTAQ